MTKPTKRQTHKQQQNHNYNTSRPFRIINFAALTLIRLDGYLRNSLFKPKWTHFQLFKTGWIFGTRQWSHSVVVDEVCVKFMRWRDKVMRERCYFVCTTFDERSGLTEFEYLGTGFGIKGEEAKENKIGVSF